MPTAVLDNDIAAAKFRAAVADLIADNGNLKFRPPREQEFNTLLAAVPFDEIPDPLMLAEGGRFNLIIESAKGRPFWFHDVYRGAEMI